MAIIGLEGLEFYSHHGLHSYEREEGGKFRVDVKISANTEKAEVTDAIQDTLDYERVYQLVAIHMNTPVNLLETLAASIANDILNGFPGINWVEVEVSKLEPPIEGKCIRTYVSVKKAFN